MVEFTVAILSFAVLLTGALYLGAAWLSREHVQQEAMAEALRLSLQNERLADFFTEASLVATRHRIVPRMAPGDDWHIYDTTEYAAPFEDIRDGVSSRAFGMMSAERQETVTTENEAQRLLGLPPHLTLRWQAWTTQLGGLY